MNGATTARSSSRSASASSSTPSTWAYTQASWQRAERVMSFALSPAGTSPVSSSGRFPQPTRAASVIANRTAFRIALLATRPTSSFEANSHRRDSRCLERTGAGYSSSARGGLESLVGLLPELVAVAGGEVQAVELLQLHDAGEGRLAEGRLPLEGMEHDALEQVAEAEVMELGERAQHLEDAPLHADAGLHPLDDLGLGLSRYHGTTVPRYRSLAVEERELAARR